MRGLNVQNNVTRARIQAKHNTRQPTMFGRHHTERISQRPIGMNSINRTTNVQYVTSNNHEAIFRRRRAQLFLLRRGRTRQHFLHVQQAIRTHDNQVRTTSNPNAFFRAFRNNGILITPICRSRIIGLYAIKRRFSMTTQRPPFSLSKSQ